MANERLRAEVAAAQIEAIQTALNLARARRDTDVTSGPEAAAEFDPGINHFLGYARELTRFSRFVAGTGEFAPPTFTDRVRRSLGQTEEADVVEERGGIVERPPLVLDLPDTPTDGMGTVHEQRLRGNGQDRVGIAPRSPMPRLLNLGPGPSRLPSDDVQEERPLGSAPQPSVLPEGDAISHTNGASKRPEATAGGLELQGEVAASGAPTEATSESSVVEKVDKPLPRPDNAERVRGRDFTDRDIDYMLEMVRVVSDEDGGRFKTNKEAGYSIWAAAKTSDEEIPALRDVDSKQQNSFTVSAANERKVLIRKLEDGLVEKDGSSIPVTFEYVVAEARRQNPLFKSRGVGAQDLLSILEGNLSVADIEKRELVTTEQVEATITQTETTDANLATSPLAPGVVEGHGLDLTSSSSSINPNADGEIIQGSSPVQQIGSGVVEPISSGLGGNSSRRDESSERERHPLDLAEMEMKSLGVFVRVLTQRGGFRNNRTIIEATKILYAKKLRNEGVYYNENHPTFRQVMQLLTENLEAGRRKLDLLRSAIASGLDTPSFAKALLERAQTEVGIPELSLTDIGNLVDGKTNTNKLKEQKNRAERLTESGLAAEGVDDRSNDSTPIPDISPSRARAIRLMLSTDDFGNKPYTTFLDAVTRTHEEELRGYPSARRGDRVDQLVLSMQAEVRSGWADVERDRGRVRRGQPVGANSAALLGWFEQEREGSLERFMSASAQTQMSVVTRKDGVDVSKYIKYRPPVEAVSTEELA